MKELYQRDQIVDLKVTGCNRGRLLVEGENLYGFVPFSHLIEMAGQVDLSEREKYLEAYVGRTLRLKVIECVPEDGRIVFSERAAQAEPDLRAGPVPDHHLVAGLDHVGNMQGGFVRGLVLILD